MNFKNDYKNKILNIDKYLYDFFKKYTCSENVISNAMSYSVLNGGKRLRSILCMEVCKMFGGDCEAALPFAAAIELIHAYSLVHDDLPAMDNSDVRRGQPSCHKKFGESIGILCGDALLNSAYELMIINCDTPAKRRAAVCIAEAAGVLGMINGQVIDLQAGASQLPDNNMFIKLVEQKTMALIRAATLAGAYIAECNETTVDLISKFAYHLGIAFQIRDDFEDIVEDDENASASPNFIRTFGNKKAAEMLKFHSYTSFEILSKYDKIGFLSSLHKYLFNLHF